MKLRRLGMVRAALRSREGPPPLVKSAALSHSFWHLGQFAHDYRATFGESPSETLARPRGPAAVEGKPRDQTRSVPMGASDPGQGLS